jgi:acetyl esterase/lipase
VVGRLPLKILFLLTLGVAVGTGPSALGAQEVSASFHVVKDVPYLAPDQSEKLDLYLPERGPGDPPAPAVIWMHGNHHDKGEARERSFCETLAGAGYVCISLNYGTWTDSDDDPAAPARNRQNIANAKTAVRFLRVHAGEYHLDSSRIAAFGGSAGAYLALNLGFPDDVGLDGMGPYQGVSSAVEAVGDFYGDYDAPMKNRITAKYPPIFIAQGKIDPAVDYRQSIALDRIFAARGVPHEFVLLENVGHGFDLTTWNHQPLPRDLRPAVLEFLAKYLGPPPHGASAAGR